MPRRRGQAPPTSAIDGRDLHGRSLRRFELLALPLRFYQSFVIERRYGLSAVPLRIWIADHLKSAGISLAFALIAAAIVHVTLVRWPLWWWAMSSLTFILAAIVLARIAPIVLLPILYRFKPLDRASLRARLESLSSRAGVPCLASTNGVSARRPAAPMPRSSAPDAAGEFCCRIRCSRTTRTMRSR